VYSLLFRRCETSDSAARAVSESLERKLVAAKEGFEVELSVVGRAAAECAAIAKTAMEEDMRALETKV